MFEAPLGEPQRARGGRSTPMSTPCFLATRREDSNARIFRGWDFPMKY